MAKINPSAAAQPTVVVTAPFSSLKFVATVALLSPLATVLWSTLWSLHGSSNSDDDFFHHRRHLQIAECTVNTNTTTKEAEEQSMLEAITSTSIIAASVAFLCLLGYELFRRDPIVGKYVYDRKRLSQPGRTPPPLMLSRSLWRGYDDDGEKNGSSIANNNRRRLPCCKVSPAILEFMFINLDKIYITYSRAADEARKEREKRGYYTCCRSGWYHRNCCNRIARINSCSAAEDEDYFVDEDGYIFYPGNCQEYSHIYQCDESVATYSPQKRSQTKLSLPSTDLVEGAPETEEVKSPSWTMSIRDLFPEDAKTSLIPLGAVDEEEEEEEGCDPRHFFASKRLESFESARSSVIDEVSEGLLMQENGDGDNLQGEDDALPTTVRRDNTTAKTENRIEEAMQNESHNEVDSDENDLLQQSVKPLRYPYRLKSLFMPPGFHKWTNVLDYLRYFFLVPLFSRWCHNSRCNEEGNDRGSVLVNPGKNLTEGEEELLRCAGLDTYLLVRLARFGFDVTYYPFLFSCVAVLPIYYSCKDHVDAPEDRYISLTINSIPAGSLKIVWIFVFTILLYLYIMRRLWLEWEVFIKLRHSFLVNGDKSFHKSPLYLKKYRNTCMVERVPKSLRSDRNINDVFESLFPDQIETAEMLIDTSKLEEILKQREKLINKYDSIDARYRYECWKYSSWQQGGKVGGCCKKISEPVEPKVRDGFCSKEKEDAFPYYNNKIKEMDMLADKEYGHIVNARLKWRSISMLTSSENEEDVDRNSAHFSAHKLWTLFVPSKVRRKLFGDESEFFLGVGMVTFKSIAAKQAAVQCNLSGQPYWMLTNDAPDPRDLFWSNIGVDRKQMENRKIVVQFVLLLGILAWGTIVTFIMSFTTQVFEDLPFGVIQGYLPALVVSLVLLWIPNLFFLLARKVIRFKSHSRCDEFVLLWNTGYRLANVFFTFFGISFIQALQCARENPDQFVRQFANGILRQSAFLMNLMILATGQETMLQLLQWRSLIKQAIIRPLTNLNARSRRYIDWLNEAPPFEKSFLFGFFAPVLSYGLMIAMVYAFMAPVMLGVCAIFFWTATKVHTHNALFVYCQRCEGGGKLFYYWNRVVFITLYTSIIVFAGILGLKGFTTQGVALFFVMTLGTYCFDASVKNTFVVNSLHLPISIARIHDEEEVALIGNSKIQPDGGEKFMYRHPVLNQQNWNKKATWS